MQSWFVEQEVLELSANGVAGTQTRLIQDIFKEKETHVLTEGLLLWENMLHGPPWHQQIDVPRRGMNFSISAADELTNYREEVEKSPWVPR